MWKSLDSQLWVILSLGDTWQFLGVFWLPHWGGLEMQPTLFSAVWVEKLGLHKGSQDLCCIPNRKSALRSWLLYTALLFLSPGQQGADRG